MEFHDDQILRKRLLLKQYFDVDPVKEIAVQTVKKDPLELCSSSSDDFDFDLDDTDVRDGLF